VQGSPVPSGTLVDAFSESGDWKQVAVQGAPNGVSGMRGWVAAQYLKREPDRVPVLKLADSVLLPDAVG
jgi:hypothetical protein